jgi:hypothetical protein
MGGEQDSLVEERESGEFQHLALDPLDEIPEIARKASFWRAVLEA